MDGAVGDSNIEPSSLEIAKFHLSQEKATIYVNSLLELLGISVPPVESFDADVPIEIGGKSIRFNFLKSVEEARKTGVLPILQDIVDANDRFLAPILPLSAGVPPGGLSIDIKAKLGTYHTEVRAPGLIESPELSLSKDILAFRESVCENSRTDGFETCTRYYRGYLQACISIVDCFLSRYAFTVKGMIGNIDTFENTQVLGSITGIENRIDAWFTTFALHHKDDYKKTPEWSQFQELRAQRNQFVHPSEPAARYSMREMKKFLNFCRGGIGGLLALFRNYTGYSPLIGSIQKVRTAPLVTYHG